MSYLMSGRQVGLDTLGGIVANEISQVAQLGICLMVVFLVVRHTRAEEESGRAELLRSTVLGRDAATLAGAAVASATSCAGSARWRTTLVWLSPFGWAQGMDAFGSERWWPAALLLAFTALLLAVAARLMAHRDFGGGLLATRPGPARAGRLLGILYGAVIPTVPDLIASNPEMADVVGASGQAAEDALGDAFLGYIYLFMAVIACGFVVSSVLRLRAEEEVGRTEVVLATPVSRTGWMAATTAVALIAAAKLTVLMGLGLAVGYGLGSGEWDQVLPQLGGQSAYLPGTLAVVALAVALYGYRRRDDVAG